MRCQNDVWTRVVFFRRRGAPLIITGSLLFPLLLVLGVSSCQKSRANCQLLIGLGAGNGHAQTMQKRARLSDSTLSKYSRDVLISFSLLRNQRIRRSILLACTTQSLTIFASTMSMVLQGNSFSHWRYIWTSLGKRQE
jgi:hypothetical protein